MLDQGEKLDKDLVGELSTSIAVNDVDVLAFVMGSLPIYKEYTDKSPKRRNWSSSSSTAPAYWPPNSTRRRSQDRSRTVRAARPRPLL